MDKMPGTIEERDMLTRIMLRHGLAQADLARETGYDSAYVSRICSGQHPVTIVLARALYRLTGDEALRDFIFGPIDDELQQRRDLRDALATAAAACLQATGDPSPARLAALDRAQTRVDQLRSRLEGANRRRPARRLPKEGIVA